MSLVRDERVGQCCGADGREGKRKRLTAQIDDEWSRVQPVEDRR